VLTPTRELAAQILEELERMATHTPITGAAVFGGVGMGPQEHAFRSGVDVLVATPGRLLDHLKQPYAKLDGSSSSCSTKPTACSTWASCPTSSDPAQALPTKRQTLFFSATMPAPIAQLSHEMLNKPATINLERRPRRPWASRRPSTRCRRSSRPTCSRAAQAAARCRRRWCSRAPSTAPTAWPTQLVKPASRPTASTATARRRSAPRSPASRTAAQVLVATDIAARGIDVEALGHVVNFDVPHMPEDYIHRVGRTARAEATGEAFTFVSPDEEGDLKQIEKAIGKRLPRVTLPDFDYTAKPQERSRCRSPSASRDPRPQGGGARRTSRGCRCASTTRRRPACSSRAS
jgi:ATP-dependent RNA helicase RhlE